MMTTENVIFFGIGLVIGYYAVAHFMVAGRAA